MPLLWDSKSINKMNKEFIPYEQALALKELGFDEPCFGYYDNKELSIYWAEGDEIINLPITQNGNSLCDYECLAPLYQQAFRWFRDKYHLWNMIYPRDGWNYSVQRVDETISCVDESFHSAEINEYNETELACLIKLIEIVKNK